LDFDGALHCIKNTREFGEHAVAGGVGNSTSMTGDEVVNDSATGGQRGHRRLLVAVHQAAISLDIGREDCCETSLERRSLHPLPFHETTEHHQRADTVADDFGDREHRG
jgi:hypothetical protein